MKRYVKLFKEAKTTMTILFLKTDYDEFLKDYKDELDEFNIKIESRFDKKAGKDLQGMMVVLLKGDSNYLSNYRFHKDIEKNYNGSIA